MYRSAYASQAPNINFFVLADLFPAVTVARCSPCARRAGVTESCPQRLRQSSDRISFPHRQTRRRPTYHQPQSQHPSTNNSPGPEPFRQRQLNSLSILPTIKSRHTCLSPALRLLRLPRPKTAILVSPVPPRLQDSPLALPSVALQASPPCPPALGLLLRARPVNSSAVVPTKPPKVRPYSLSLSPSPPSAHRIHPVEALDQWFENLQNYEATLVSVSHPLRNQLCPCSR